LEVVDEVDAAMKGAISRSEGSAWGAVFMVISAMLILMQSASEFGITRRERQLLRRIAKARLAATGETSK
jgi:alkylation response protein AidB-like acyl-CoA dehydrogenase